MEPFNIQPLPLIILFIVPGLIAMQTYRLCMPAHKINWHGASLEGLLYGGLNLGLCSPVIILLQYYELAQRHIWLYALVVLAILVVAPALWAYLYAMAIRTKWYKKKFLTLHPTAWDWFFDKRQQAFVLIHLNDGTKIGGLYGSDSYAGSSPNDGELYLEKVITTNKQTGEFNGYVENTKGLIIRRDQYQFVELFPCDYNQDRTQTPKGDHNATK